MRQQYIKKFTILSLIIISLISCASCKKCKKCNGSSIEDSMEVPTISNPNGTYLKIGNYEITNNDAYFQLVNSFGLETLMNFIDDDIIPHAPKDEKFDEFLDNIIYGEEEKNEENLQKFINNLPLSGLSNNPNDKNYYKDYYYLRYSRIQHAKNSFKQKYGNTYFTQTQLDNTFNELFSRKCNMVVLRFDSTSEARKVLEAKGINLNKLNSGWEKNDGTKLTNTEILKIFEDIYKDYHKGDSNASKEYTYTDLKNINSSLLLDVYYMDVNTYTKTIKNYNGNAFLVYKEAQTDNLDANGKSVTLEEKKDEVINELIDLTVTTNYSTAYILAEEMNANLVIYDKGLENTFALQYEYIKSTLAIENNEVKNFTKSTDTSKTNVFSYTISGNTKYVTADEFFTRLVEQYGSYLASLYMKQYLILKDNKVLDITNFQILDKEKYDAFYKKDITEYKEKFLNDEYTKIGFSSSYGWENFIRDYLGLLSENRILINLDSSLYEENLRLFKETLFLDENSTDKKIQDEMEKIAEDYFYATTLELRVYYDNNLDGVADEIAQGSQEELLARQLISEVFNKINSSTYSSVTTELNNIYNSYNISSIYQNNNWKKYKEAGLRLELASSKTYTANTSADTSVLKQIKLQYETIINFKNDNNGVDLAGIDLSNYYRNPKLDKPVNALDFVDSTCTNLIDNKISCHIITKAFDQPYITESTGNYKPTYEDYQKYYEDSSKLSSSLKNCISNFYLPAISNVVSDTYLNDLLMNKCLELISNDVTYGNKEGLTTYIKACKTSANVDD